MLYLLRHLAVCLWSTIILGGLMCLWTLPLLQSYVGLSWILLPVLLTLFLVFLSIEWASNRYAIHLIERIIAEATIWERAGKSQKAEHAYKKAIAVFDSFLLSPAAKKKRSTQLVAHLARFYLARVDKNHGSEAFIVSYLRSHPEDGEVAESWLHQIKNQSEFSDTYQDLAFRIGNAQPDNKNIQRSLARLYVSAGRTDFPALQTYRRVLKENGKELTDIIVALSSIFLEEGRADEWALEVYLQAYRRVEDKTFLLNGIAACVHWIPENGDNVNMLHRARKLLADIDDVRLKQMHLGFNPPVFLSFEEKKPSHRFKIGIVLYRAALWLFTFFYKHVRTSSIFIFGQAAKWTQKIRGTRISNRFLKRTGLTVLTAGMIFLLINTIGHLLKPRTLSEKGGVAVVAVTDPFTLQVAAYLKLEHAERYVSYLKKHNLNAYWTEAVGKKKKWYQVRVSHFADKNSAIAYGKSLKAKGLIDDFYVANYSNP